MELIETVTVGAGGAASIQFNSIPSDGTDLVLLMRTKSTTTGIDAYVAFNSTTTSGGTSRLYGINTSLMADQYAPHPVLYGINRSSTNANSFGVARIYIHNYATAVNKIISVTSFEEDTVSGAYTVITGNNWASTATISSIQITTTANLAQYSTVSLYKVTRA